MVSNSDRLANPLPAWYVEPSYDAGALISAAHGTGVFWGWHFALVSIVMMIICACWSLSGAGTGAIIQLRRPHHGFIFAIDTFFCLFGLFSAFHCLVLLRNIHSEFPDRTIIRPDDGNAQQRYPRLAQYYIALAVSIHEVQRSLVTTAALGLLLNIMESQSNINPPQEQDESEKGAEKEKRREQQQSITSGTANNPIQQWWCHKGGTVFFRPLRLSCLVILPFVLLYTILTALPLHPTGNMSDWFERGYALIFMGIVFILITGPLWMPLIYYRCLMLLYFLPTAFFGFSRANIRAFLEEQPLGRVRGSASSQLKAMLGRFALRMYFFLLVFPPFFYLPVMMTAVARYFNDINVIATLSVQADLDTMDIYPIPRPALRESYQIAVFFAGLALFLHSASQLALKLWKRGEGDIECVLDFVLTLDLGWD